MIYQYICNNPECVEYEIVKDVSMSIAEYSEDKLPVCEHCNTKTIRKYSSFGLRTADNYKTSN